MIIATKGKGSEIKWVDEQELPATKELVKFKKENDEKINKLSSQITELKSLLEQAKLENINIIKELISR